MLVKDVSLLLDTFRMVFRQHYGWLLGKYETISLLLGNQRVKTNYTTGFLGVNLGGVGMIFFLITSKVVQRLAISMLLVRYLSNVHPLHTVAMENDEKTADFRL